MNSRQGTRLGCPAARQEPRTHQLHLIMGILHRRRVTCKSLKVSCSLCYLSCESLCMLSMTVLTSFADCICNLGLPLCSVPRVYHFQGSAQTLCHPRYVDMETFRIQCVATKVQHTIFVVNADLNRAMEHVVIGTSKHAT